MKLHVFHSFAVATLVAGMAFAQQSAQSEPHKAPFAHPSCGHQQMMQALNLTTEQQQKANTIFGDAKVKAEPIREEMRQNREALYAAVKANNAAQIERLSTHQGELHGKMVAIHSEARARFYAMLTPEQRTKADQMHQEMRSRMRQRSETRN